MNESQAELYRRLQGFSLDEPNAVFPFSKRLACENSWSIKYTQRVIEEYKKFAFLAVSAGHPVSPCDQVDQVWHLHLIYTHSYWSEFCPKVLQMPLHHQPTRGGEREYQKFQDWYTQTLASYEYFFRETPPADIWTPADVRFGRKTPRNWSLPRYLRRAAIPVLLFVLALTVSSCEPLVLASVSNPLDFKGPEFISFYLLVASVVTYLALILRWYLRKPADSAVDLSNSLDEYEIAYLAAGNNRVVDAAIASLVQRGHLQLQTNMLELGTPLPSNSHRLERAIAQAVRNSGNLNQVRQAVEYQIDVIKERLQNLGLLVNERQAKVVQWFPALLVFGVLMLGVTKIFVGISRQKPVTYLVILCIATAIIECWLLVKPYRTRYGDRILNNLQARHESLQKTSASQMAQLGLAVGLFGSVVLVDSTFADLKRVLVPPQNTGSGGGGCGGCGG